MGGPDHHRPSVATWAIAGTALMVLYILSYLSLTFMGEYQNAWIGAGSFSGSYYSEVWQPRFVFRRHHWHLYGTEMVRTSLLGKVYGPLVDLDALLWHRPRK